ncbi:MAG: hypothetical protein ACREWG_16495 [Gammaproteobacteria bacterium]
MRRTPRHSQGLTSPRCALAGALALASVLCSGCDFGGPDGTPALRSQAGPIPAEPQRPGDPEQGYHILVNGGTVSCGIPYSAYVKSAKPPAAEALLAGRTGRNAALPYSFNAYRAASGVELVVSNCLTCHAAHFNGELIVGLGNESLDFTQDRVAYAEGIGALIEDPREAEAWRKWADRVAAISPYITTDTVGVNPAIDLTWALFAHRDPHTLRWSDRPLIAPPSGRPLPVSVPPWWRMKKKHALFYNGAGRGDHARLMILASTLCTDTLSEAQAIDRDAAHIRAYLASLSAPRYPFPVDAPLAEHGARVFLATCSRCHGTYGAEGRYPNLLIALDEVGTDPLLARAGTDGSEERFQRWLHTSFYGEHSRLAPAEGYVAPPLDGVWATAPYLHNGSIPTLAALLDSPARPRYWRRSHDTRDYDPATLGWRYTDLLGGKAETPADQRKWVYDTTLRGYSNAGHGYGDGLTERERKAVIEYLKTL